MKEKLYVITFVEGDVINRKVKINSTSKDLALIIFHLQHPNAIDEKIEEVTE